jgi:hypothetical protein
MFPLVVWSPNTVLCQSPVICRVARVQNRPPWPPLSSVPPFPSGAVSEELEEGNLLYVSFQASSWLTSHTSHTTILCMKTNTWPLEIHLARLQWWSQWHTPVIPPTWEAEISRITVWGQARQKVSKIPSLTNKWGMGACTCNPSSAGGTGRKIAVWGQPQARNTSLYLKNQKELGMTWV